LSKEAKALKGPFSCENKAQKWCFLAPFWFAPMESHPNLVFSLYAMSPAFIVQTPVP
jgi:hypothetical protein